MILTTVLFLAILQRPAPAVVKTVMATPSATAVSYVELLADYPQLVKGTVVSGPDGTIVDSRTLTNYGGGQYLVWNVSGHVVIRATVLAGPNAVISGVFIGPQKTQTNPVIFVRNDIVVSGTWKGTYGSAGYGIAADALSFPSDVVFAPSGQQTYTWADPSTDSRALQKSTGSARIMSGWYNSTFKIDLTISGTQAREVAVYVTDYDSGTRQTRFDVSVPTMITDATPWQLTGWELGAFDGTVLANSLAYDTFPSDDTGTGHFRVPAELFPLADKAYAVSLRYRWISPNVDPSLPAIVAYTPWTRAVAIVTRRSNGMLVVQ